MSTLTFWGGMFTFLLKVRRGDQYQFHLYMFGKEAALGRRYLRDQDTANLPLSKVPYCILTPELLCLHVIVR